MKTWKAIVLVCFISIPSLLMCYFERGFGSSCIGISGNTATNGYRNRVWGYDNDHSNATAETNTSHPDIVKLHPVENITTNKVILTEKGDIDGDGIDDIIQVHACGTDIGKYDAYVNVAGNIVNTDGIKDGTELVVFNGATGIVMTSFTNDDGIYIVGAADVDGDGKDELVTVSHYGTDVTFSGKHDHIKDGSMLVVYDYNYLPTGILERSVKWYYTYDRDTFQVRNPNYAMQAYDGIDFIKFGDFDGNGIKDIAFVQRFGYRNTTYPNLSNSVTIIKNGYTGTTMWWKHNIYLGNLLFAGGMTYILEVANLDADAADELVRVRYSGSTANNDPHPELPFTQTQSYPVGCQSYMDVWDINSNLVGNLYTGTFLGEVSSDNSSLIQHIAFLRIGKLYDNGSIQLCYVRHADFTLNGGSTLIVRTFNSEFPLNSPPHEFIIDSPNFGYRSYIFELGDLNNDTNQDQEIITASHNVNNQNASTLKILDWDGSDIVLAWSNNYTTSHIEKIAVCDFDNTQSSNKINLVAIHKKASLPYELNIIEYLPSGSPLTAYVTKVRPIDESSNCTSWNNILVLKNEITDDELTKSFPGYPTIDQVVNLMLINLNHMNLNYGVPHAFYYASNNTLSRENILTSLRQFSTIYASEPKQLFPDNERWCFEVNKPLPIAYRLLRLINTLKYGGTVPEIDKYYIVKAILAHVRLLSSAAYNLPNNSNVLYLNPWYCDGIGALTGCVDNEQFQNIFNERYCDLINEVPADGCYEENSFNYSKVFNYNAIRTAWRSIEPAYAHILTPRIYTLMHSAVTAEPIKNKLLAMNRFYLYTIKPNIPTPANSDLPMFGDTYAASTDDCTSYGKFNATTGTSSSLHQIIEEFPGLFSGGPSDYTTKLKSNIEFASQCPTHGGVVPDSTSVEFPDGKFFVSRSNWTLPSSSTYDNNAAYMLFKVGNPKPFETNKHAHCDFLSLELTDHGKNLIIDPAGYGVSHNRTDDTTTPLTLPYQSYDSIWSKYRTIYYKNPFVYTDQISNIGWPPYFTTIGDEELKGQHLLRQYFKGTAVHSTIYEPAAEMFNYTDTATDTLFYFGHSTEDYCTLNVHPIDSQSNPKVDLVTGSITYWDAMDLSRTVVFLKPQNAGVVDSPYWFILDKVNPAVDVTYQNWHLASGYIPTDNTITGNYLYKFSRNCESPSDGIGIHIAGFSSTPGLQVNTLDSWSSQRIDGSLVDTKTISFSRPMNTVDGVEFKTIIQPYIVSNAVINKLDVCDTNNYTVVPDSRALAFSYQYQKSGVTYQDIFFLSFEDSHTFWYDNNWDGIRESTSDRLVFKRRVGGIQIDTFCLDWTSKDSSDNTPLPLSLMNNYPNPFNPTTTISFSIPKASKVEVVVYNVKGQVVKILTHSKWEKGKHDLVWDGMDDNSKPVASGVYFYRMSVNNKVIDTKKCLMLK